MTGLPPGGVAVLGVPLDENSSFRRGAALGPARIREVLASGSMNLCAENGLDLGTDRRWRDVGDVRWAESKSAFAEIEQTAGELLAAGARVLSLGGDHSVTYPIVRAHAGQWAGLTILHLDAHPDLYDDFEGNRHSHACPFARIMEERLAAHLVQAGVRTVNPHQRAQAERFGVQMVEMRDWRPNITFEFRAPVYLSLDLDVLDPAFAPGVAHHEPGGLTTRDVIHIIQTMKGRLVGADVVELNPERDWAGVTAAAAAKLVKEILARMLEI